MKDWDNDIESIFTNDSRSKKRIGSNVTKRASRRGYIRGGVRTQSDFLTPKQRKALNGEVRVRSMYEDINKLPKWEELMAMPDEKQKEIFKKAKENQTGSKLQKYWSVSSGKLYGYYAKYNLYEKKTTAKPNIAKGNKKHYKTIDEVPTYKEFLDMDRGNRTLVLTQIRDTFSMQSLRKYWNISQGGLYNQLYTLGIVKKGETGKGKKAVAPKVEEVAYLPKQEELVVDEAPNVEELVVADVPEHTIDISYEGEKIAEIVVPKEEAPVIETVPEQKEVDFNSFSINLKGKYTRQEVENRIFRALMTMDLDKVYDFELSIKE